MDTPTHIYCEVCSSIQPVIVDPLEAPDVSGEYLSGDLTCATCHIVIITVFKEA